MRREYELRLGDGRRVLWDGADGVDASWRYARAHRGTRVIAWRLSAAECYGLFTVTRILYDTFIDSPEMMRAYKRDRERT